MNFLPGQKILFLHEPGGGIIVEIIDRYNVLIACEDGFNRGYRIADITTLKGDLESSIPDDLKPVTEAKGSEQKAKKNSGKGSRALPTIDLHIHALTDNDFDERNGRALERQLIELKRFIESCRERKIRDLIVIHGVGSGVLRNEVRQYLSGLSGVEFFDADYTEFGAGATRVLIRYSY